MKKDTVIIGLGYQKQTGKSTAADIIAMEFHATHEVYQMAFAQKLKEEVAKIFNTTIGWIEANKNHPLIRHALQWYGTDYIREEDPDHWIKQIEREIFELETHVIKRARPLMVIIQDTRFQNEADWIKGHGGFVFRVIRPSVIEDELSSHPSETELSDYPFNFTIRNEQGLEFLRTECKVVSEMIRHMISIR